MLAVDKNITTTRDHFLSYITELQETICKTLEDVDGKGVFRQDSWERTEGGGGISRIMENGRVFEKGGVNISAVHGELPIPLQDTIGVNESRFFACGLSLVIHPLNPYIPTVHANWRYFELYDNQENRKDCWFGGGSDLTPYYIFPEDATHFHLTLKEAMEPFGSGLYLKYKRQCDEYFVNLHREKEARGIGGVFYDYLRPVDENDEQKLLSFQQSIGNAFLPAYLPIVRKRMEHPFGENELIWQEIRRGRYVEFNLIHDRGTLFGLKTNGRTESILMSLPPRVRWRYDYHPAPGSPEAALLEYLKPRDWVNVR